MAESPPITPDFLASVSGRITVFCVSCRSCRDKDPLELVVAGKGAVPLARIKFMCLRHDPPVRGKPIATWWSDQRERVEIEPE